MAVLRQELNWSTYQDKQLQILQSLETSFKDSLQRSKSLGDNLLLMRASLESIARATDATARAMSSSYRIMEQSSRIFTSNMTDAARSMSGLSSAVNNTRIIYDQHGKVISDVDEMERQRLENVKKREIEEEKLYNSLSQTLKKFVSNVGKYADEYSTLSNQMIRMTGASGADVRDTRDTIVSSIIAQLNSETGSFFNPEEAYKSMISISNSAGIGNVETIEKLTRPIMLAQASMDINISGLATLLGKWSTRYNFSSMAMEEIVDDIRGNTANNQATAQQALENISKLETLASYYSMGNEDKLKEMSDSITKGTSWLQSMNVDTSRYTDYIEMIATGDAKNDIALSQILQAAGLSQQGAQDMFISGDIQDLYKALFEGEVNIMSSLRSSGADPVLAQTLKSKDLDKAMIDSYNAANSSNYVSLEDFELSTSNAATAVESIEDQYVSLQDKANNYLNDIYKVVASIQEHLGIGLSDITGILGFLAGAGLTGKGSIGNIKALGSRLASGGSNLISGVSGGSALGAGLLGATGIGLGVGGGIYGISKGVDQISNGNTGLGSTNIAGGGLALGGAAALGAGMLGVGATNAWNPLGWALLAAGGITMASTTMIEAMDATSGASSTVESKFDELSKSFNDEQFNRIDQIEALKESIASTGNFDEALKLVSDSGLVDLEEGSYETTQQLIDMLSAIQETSAGLMSLNDAALNAAEAIIAERAAEDDENVKNTLKDYISGKFGEDNVLNKDDEDYYTIKAVFEQLAESITDETARKEAQNDIKKIFSDNTLTYDELAFLTDTGGNMLAAGSLELDRKDNMFRQNRDLSKTNAALSLLGLSGYDLSDLEAASQLASIYSDWMKATSPEDKKELASQYAKIYNGLDKETQSAYKNQIKSMGINSYDVGTNYVDSDQLAFIHEGEAIIPKKYNTASNDNFEKLIKQQMSASNSHAKLSEEALRDMLGTLSDIKKFLAAWRQENKTRAIIEQQQSKYSAASATVANYGSTSGSGAVSTIQSAISSLTY